MAPKVYVLDTSTLIENPEIINPYKAEDYFVIPAVVLRQLDGLKNNPATSYNARKASQYIEQMQAEERLAVTDRYIPVNMLENKADNMIVGTAIFTKENVDDYEVCLASTDRNMRIAANYYGVDTVKAIEPKSSFYIGGMNSWGSRQIEPKRVFNTKSFLFKFLMYLLVLLGFLLPLAFNIKNEDIRFFLKFSLGCHLIVVPICWYVNSDWRISRMLKREAKRKVKTGFIQRPIKNRYDNSSSIEVPFITETTCTNPVWYYHIHNRD